PAEFESSFRSSDIFTWQIPCARIEDAPRFPYRGMHLDVGRHFFPVDFIKKYIDLLAMHKFNRFHWHLTEDQGWRIEIKQYPKLQEV
ncbi:MAG TPA: family 20 glycosylhydrolase, partial [Saprospiraceae bacterium]|nr:family 20 glycosylhydrolase [Saprospiraceae bacterium]